MRPFGALVIIVNFRTPELTLAAIASLQGEVESRDDTHVVIVDNGSGDGSLEMIAHGVAERGFARWCSVHDAGANRGFAAGNNAALRWHRQETGGALPEYCWLLNPDTRAEPGALGALIAFLETHPEAGIAGSRCLHETGKVWPSAFRFHSPGTELNAGLAFGPAEWLLRLNRVALPVQEQPAAVDWVSGASMLVRRAVIERIGLMDEEYFLYFEETDYCRRARDAGFSVWTVPASCVVHLGGQATGVTAADQSRRRRPRYWFASRARFLLQLHGKAGTHLANLLWLAGYPLGRLIGAMRGRDRDDPRRLWLDFLTAYYGPGGIMYRPARRARRMGVD